jgi:hypothetical protein
VGACRFSDSAASSTFMTAGFAVSYAVKEFGRISTLLAVLARW